MPGKRSKFDILPGKNPTGAPSKYKTEYNDLALMLCRLGADDKMLAETFQIAESTLNDWKNAEPTFMESIRKGRELSDAEVADRMYMKAMGYEREEIELKVVALGGNKGSEVKAIPVKRWYPPDTIAQIFWLKNRQPRWWKDRVDPGSGDKAPVVWNETKTYKGDKPRKKK